ncbi:histidine phosphatase family protein [Sulfitobacter sp. HNIBRBA3233]|uniref:histidine phosphatase family protein n=1 Tax=Sulfitobacter marinivivus TaxID=3158558 RepID=UPI0032DE3FC3
MTRYPDLYVLRHGETAWNAEGRLQGHLDSALTTEGRAQAARQAGILRNIDLSGADLRSSPQGRAWETARTALAGRGPIRSEPLLREIGVGAWAGRRRDDIAATWPVPIEGFELYEQAPEGEGFAALEARCRLLLQRLDRPTVLVTHGMTSRMIRAIALGLGRAGVADVDGGQGVVFHISNGVQNRLE